MANIKFVKPPPDNRIRSFPPALGEAQKQCHITPGLEQLETEPTLHITTPKRRKDHLPQWDIFITSKHKVDSVTGESSSMITNLDINRIQTAQVTTQTQIVLPQNTSKPPEDLPQTFKKLQEANSQIIKPSNVGTLQMTTKDTTEVVSVDKSQSSNKSFDSELNIEAHNGITKIGDRQKENASIETSIFHGWVGEQNQTQDSKRTTAPHHSPTKQRTTLGLQYIGLSDVSEDEVACLPEVKGTSASITTADGENQDHTYPKSHTNVARGKAKSHHVTERNDSKLSLIGLPRRPYPIGPLRRSISEFDFSYENPYDDEDEDISFFSRVKNSKQDNKPKKSNLQNLEAAPPDKFKSGPTHFPRYAWTERNFMKTVFGGSDLALPSKGVFAMKENRSSMESPECGSEYGQFSGPSTPVEQFSVTDDSQSGSFRARRHSARLTMRRFALADPERMIISQELREKLEKDVQKRKSSKVRKVSQFFNIQLGLNKEEDLI